MSKEYRKYRLISGEIIVTEVGASDSQKRISFVKPCIVQQEVDRAGQPTGNVKLSQWMGELVDLAEDKIFCEIMDPLPTAVMQAYLQVTSKIQIASTLPQEKH